MVVRRTILDPSECAAVADDVLALRTHWIRRMPGAEFYTLGAASYLDEQPQYRARANELNPLLRTHFTPLHAVLASALADVLASPIELAPDKAVPGFHVWGVPGIPTEPVASLHFDLQYERLAWPDDADLSQTLSFTLPVRLPRRGGGLTMWDTTKPRIDAFFRKCPFPAVLQDFTILMPEHFEPYTCGELVVHSGLELHRIAPIASVEPDDLRITMQGHGVRVGTRWQIYW